MKYCVKCGAQMDEFDKYCPKCGWMQQGDATTAQAPTDKKQTPKGIVTANKVLLVILCVSLCLTLVMAVICSIFSGVWLESIRQFITENGDEYAGLIHFVYWMMGSVGIAFLWFGALPLAWTVPMTVHYFKKTKANEPTTVAYKVCTLIFVHLLVGVFMLCFEQNADDKKAE